MKLLHDGKYSCNNKVNAIYYFVRILTRYKLSSFFKGSLPFAERHMSSARKKKGNYFSAYIFHIYTYITMAFKNCQLMQLASVKCHITSAGKNNWAKTDGFNLLESSLGAENVLQPKEKKPMERFQNNANRQRRIK